MESLARLGMIATCVIAIYVGARTLWIWRRTRMVQELCIGTNVFSIAVGGLILTLLGALSSDPGQSPPWFWYSLGLFSLVVHVAALYAGTWKIFRPQDRWPLSVVAAATLLAGVWMVWALLSVGSSEATGARSMLLLSLRGIGLAWAAFECFRYSTMLRKRAALGLAEPMIAHRIWLWGISAIASVFIILIDMGSWGVSAQPLAATQIGLHLMSSFGLVATAAIGLAFFPPAVYVRMIERHAAAQVAAV